MPTSKVNFDHMNPILNDFDEVVGYADGNQIYDLPPKSARDECKHNTPSPPPTQPERVMMADDATIVVHQPPPHTDSATQTTILPPTVSLSTTVPPRLSTAAPSHMATATPITTQTHNQPLRSLSHEPMPSAPRAPLRTQPPCSLLSPSLAPPSLAPPPSTNPPPPVVPNDVRRAHMRPFVGATRMGSPFAHAPRLPQQPHPRQHVGHPPAFPVQQQPLQRGAQPLQHPQSQQLQPHPQPQLLPRAVQPHQLQPQPQPQPQLQPIQVSQHQPPLPNLLQQQPPPPQPHQGHPSSPLTRFGGFPGEFIPSGPNATNRKLVMSSTVEHLRHCPHTQCCEVRLLHTVQAVRADSQDRCERYNQRFQQLETRLAAMEAGHSRKRQRPNLNRFL